MKALGQFLIGQMTGAVLIMGAVVLISRIYELNVVDSTKTIAGGMITIVAIYWYIRLQIPVWQKWRSSDGEHQND